MRNYIGKGYILAVSLTSEDVHDVISRFFTAFTLEPI